MHPNLPLFCGQSSGVICDFCLFCNLLAELPTFHSHSFHFLMFLFWLSLSEDLLAKLTTLARYQVHKSYGKDILEINKFRTGDFFGEISTLTKVTSLITFGTLKELRVDS